MSDGDKKSGVASVSFLLSVMVLTIGAGFFSHLGWALGSRFLSWVAS